MCSDFLTKFTKKTPVVESLFWNLLKKRLWHSCFPVNFAKFLRTPFSQSTSWSFSYFFIDLFLYPVPSFHLLFACVASKLWLDTLYSVCLFYNLASSLFFMRAVTIFPVFCFLFLKLNLFPLCICSLFPSADWALIDCVINRKVGRIIFEAILSPSERHHNIQDNPEYNSVLPFRIILKIFAVNMLIFMERVQTR